MSFNIFVSYTIRDGQVTDDFLRELKSKFPTSYGVFVDRLTKEKAANRHFIS